MAMSGRLDQVVIITFTPSRHRTANTTARGGENPSKH
jgi:hypothetical protein